MGDFFGLPVGKTTFANRAENFVSSIDEIFPENHRAINLTNREKYVDKIKCYWAGGCRVLLTLRHPSSLYFRGSLGFKCLSGSVVIEGYSFKSEESKSYAVYSLCSHSALSFSTCDSNVTVTNELLATLESLDVLNDLKCDLESQNPLSCIVLLWKLDFPGYHKIERGLKEVLQPPIRHYEGITYFADAEEHLNCVFDTNSGNRIRGKMFYNEDFNCFSQSLLTKKTLAPRVAVCGGKGVGKSTSLRFLVNQLLTKWQNVLFIDFDIGQPEFSIPGCVYSYLVSNPLLGPNYTHIGEPLKSIFLGYVNADNCFAEYQEAIKELFAFCSNSSEFTSIPWVINTMGYIKGVGLLLLKDIISTFNLSHLIQLNNPTNQRFNMEFLLTPQNVSPSLDLSYTFKSFTLLPPGNPKSPVTPRMARDMMVCFYLISDLRIQTVVLSFNSSSEGKEVVFKSLIPHNSLYPYEILAVCLLESNGRFHNCVGFGRVISYSENNNELTLLTPLHETVFEKCCIVRGDLHIQNDFLKEILSNELPKKEKKIAIILGAGQKSKCSALFSAT